MINKELQAGRVAGPFPTPPFKNFVCSPIGIREKREKGKFRLIHDLSFPEGNSVNSHIAQEAASVKYQTLDHVITALQDAGQGAFMAKADIMEAFRLIPIAPQFYHLLGFQFNNQFYYDKALPMGLKSSCAIFEALSTALHWIMTTKFHATGVSHILDDFIFISADRLSCLSYLTSFIDICQKVGIPIKHSKTCLPSTQIEAHGILIDSVQMQAKLPMDKLNKCRQLLNHHSNTRRVTLKQIQSLIGTLQFATKVIFPGRAFLRRIINLTIGIKKPHHHITLNNEAQQDITCWLSFLTQFNGVSVFLKSHWLSSSTLNLYTDAAGSKGYAAVLGSTWTAGGFPASWDQHHITIKELYPIVLAVLMWGHRLANNKIMFHTDNIACVHIINTQTSRDKTIMKLIRRLVTASLTHNILFRAAHIPGKSNTIPDLLSRYQFQEVKALAPWLQQQPYTIPAHLLPEAILH